MKIQIRQVEGVDSPFNYYVAEVSNAGEIIGAIVTVRLIGTNDYQSAFVPVAEEKNPPKAKPDDVVDPVDFLQGQLNAQRELTDMYKDSSNVASDIFSDIEIWSNRLPEALNKRIRLWLETGK